MERIDLDRARRDAKALLRAARAGELVLRADREPRLADAQRAVAVSLGYSSWPALVSDVRVIESETALALARERTRVSFLLVEYRSMSVPVSVNGWSRLPTTLGFRINRIVSFP